MPLLLLVSFVWAASFGLIKGQLVGLDSTALGVVRIAFATIVFLPFLRVKKISASAAFQLGAIGAVEFGLMYIFYMAAFKYLAAYEVALFTIFTPLWLALIESIAQRRMPARLAIAALLAVAGAAIISWQTITTSRAIITGFLLVQGSNISFALGQFWYRRVIRKLPGDTGSAEHFALLYLGALIITLAASAFSTDWATFRPDTHQWLVLAYLGIVASGLCFFWWNMGAARVQIPTLAAFNNAKIPLGVACSILIFHESANIPRLFAGGALLVIAILVAQRRSRA